VGDMVVTTPRDEFPGMLDAIKVLLGRFDAFTPAEQELLSRWVESTHRFIRTNLDHGSGDDGDGLPLAGVVRSLPRAAHIGGERSRSPARAA